MKKHTKILLFFLLTLLISSCYDKCDDNDCGLPPLSLTFNFTAIDSVNNNIYNDTTNSYSLDSLSIFSITNGVFSPIQYTVDTCFVSTIDNSVLYSVSPPNGTSLLQIKFKHNLSYNFSIQGIYSEGDECCGKFLREYQIASNGIPFIDDCHNYQITLP